MRRIEDSPEELILLRSEAAGGKERLGLKREKGTPKMFFLTLPSHNTTKKNYIYYS